MIPAAPQAPVPGVMPRDWVHWRPSSWVGMTLAAVTLLGVAVMLHRGSWVVVPLGFFAIVTPLIAAIDLRWHVVPNRLVLPAAVGLTVLGSASALADGEPARVLGIAAGSASLFAIYLVPALVVPRSMGMGDVKLALLVGAALGAVAWPGWLIGTLAGFVTGSLIAVVGLGMRRFSRHSRMAFAPAMLAGAWIGIILERIGV